MILGEALQDSIPFTGRDGSPRVALAGNRALNTGTKPGGHFLGAVADNFRILGLIGSNCY
ncbi:MAG: hypothetical protein A3E37_04080 [Candidatus Andersenbacteria bacterium RIFCSPHIGHO2_12_FULL_46_9]|nr:MAG: hypothetical protein A3B76_06005 [Candidatus Andersenbacteria bacterium RIFCSPHIGHO2_02_FULL_46_16]OGY36047.1 MAG: hypothetical protein A3E37_04080 [Candidatus Andersenbacteria bacterium RIFCSPHIGHO2_12_FULL_46_9]OGY42745.1 MAG: hypothetical protein A3G57_03260 [Candidatus Andersenbacteria bacterium RIFCSPLOWO2_12_FULL_45_8]HBE90569.1 hypothetical protein [Candidatus Andersenbacteria bacterium]